MCQEKNEMLKLIEFGGRTLTAAERRYSTTEKELLRVYYACKRTDVYMRGHL